MTAPQPLPPPANASRMPLWSRAIASEEAHAYEQARLAHTWTFVGFAADLARDGDWVTALVGGKSVFVQRFGDTLRGFENRCVHRFYPLRRGERGNGPVVCGFHHWRYNQDGLAVGIPMCKEMFGKTPRELDARLTPIEIETCGSLVFGRFAPLGGGESLRAFLDKGFDMLEALVPTGVKARHIRRSVKANWKLSHHIGLDDYHIVAIHKSTFGKNGYLKPEVIQYFRLGLHSTFLETTRPDALDAIVAEMKAGTYRPSHYVTINLFPNLIISQFHAAKLFGADRWFVMVIRYVPVSAAFSEIRAWLFEAPFPVEMTALGRALEPVVQRIMPRIVEHYSHVVIGEDNDACERVQELAQDLTDTPLLGFQERRIAWFEESYARVVGDPADWPKEDKVVIAPPPTVHMTAG